jgi:hypothetical protein
MRMDRRRVGSTEFLLLSCLARSLARSLARRTASKTMRRDTGLYAHKAPPGQMSWLARTASARPIIHRRACRNISQRGSLPIIRSQFAVRESIFRRKSVSCSAGTSRASHTRREATDAMALQKYPQNGPNSNDKPISLDRIRPKAQARNRRLSHRPASRTGIKNKTALLEDHLYTASLDSPPALNPRQRRRRALNPFDTSDFMRINPQKPDQSANQKS